MAVTPIGTFEIHVTVPLPSDTEEYVLTNIARALGWSTSKIVGDPALGEGGKFYFTTHERMRPLAYKRMDELCTRLGGGVLRTKIECIVHDWIKGEPAQEEKT